MSFDGDPFDPETYSGDGGRMKDAEVEALLTRIDELERYQRRFIVDTFWVRVAELECCEQFLRALVAACNAGRVVTFAQGAGNYSLNIIDGDLPVRVCDVGLPELAQRLVKNLEKEQE